MIILPKFRSFQKSSLVHDDSFMERRRNRSIAGVLATIVFILSVGSYIGLYFYSNLLEEKNKKNSN